MENKQDRFAKFRQGLSKTRDNLFARLFHADACVDESFYEELEEAMILADMGMDTADRLLTQLKKQVKEDGLVPAPKQRTR